MPTLEERVAFLEGRVEEHARGVKGMRDALVHLEGRMDRRFEAVDARFNALELKMDRRLDALSESLDTKIGRLVVIQVTTLAAILAAAGGILAAVTR